MSRLEEGLAAVNGIRMYDARQEVSWPPVQEDAPLSFLGCPTAAGRFGSRTGLSKTSGRPCFLGSPTTFVVFEFYYCGYVTR